MRVFNSTALLFHDDAQQRAVLVCFGSSIALHALLLLAFPGFRPSPHPDGRKALTASFAPRAEPAEAPSVRAPWVPPERPREVRPAMPVTEPASAAVPQVAEPTSAPSPSPPGAAQPPQSEASRRAELPPAQVAARPLIDGFDTGLIDVDRLRLISSVQRSQLY